MKSIKKTIIIMATIIFFSFDVLANVTTNYLIDKGAESNIIEYDWVFSKNAGDTNYHLSTALNKPKINSYTLKVSDSEQNLAIATLSSIKMTQDDDYYYFNIIIDYANENVECNTAALIGNNEYQKIGNGTLYLSNVPINTLSYELITTQGGQSINGLKQDAVYNALDSISYSQQLSLTLNDKSGTQGMARSGLDSYSPTNNVQSSNLPSQIYSTLTFPFEEYIGSSKIKATFTPISHSWDINYNTYVYNLISNPILWTNNQQNYLMPQKLNYNPFVSCVYTNNNSVNYWNNKIKTQIKILKTDINNYRYLNMYCPESVIASITNDYFKRNYTGNADNITVDQMPSGGFKWYNNYYYITSPASKLTASSIRSENAIDLMGYTNCEHNWVYQYNSNKESHEVYCSKCEWNKFEPHNLEYEYDGIVHNACKCGYISKIHYTFEINDNTNNVETLTLDSYSNFSKNIVPVKTGYKFKCFEKYEKQFEDEYNIEFSTTNTKLKTVFIATSSTITDNTERYSTIYKVIYEPNHYIFKFSNENIKGLALSGNLEDQVFDYGKLQVIQDNIKIENYGFVGWTLKATSSEIDFKPNEEIFNYTDIDNKIFTLYPVYDVLKYKIVYSTVPCRFSNALKVMTKEYSIFDNVELEMPILEDEVYSESDGATVTTTYKFGSYTDNDKKEIKSMNEVKNLIREKGIYNYTIYLNANYLKSVTKKGGKNSGGGGSGGSGSGYIKSIKTEPAIPINGETIMNPGNIYGSNESEGNSIDIIVMDNKPEKPVSKKVEYKQYNTKNTNYTNNTNITKEAKEVIEEKFEPEVVEYILENEDAYKEVEEVINEELGVYGMSLSPEEEFYQKYGVHIATTSYLVNYHLYNVKEATKVQKVRGFIWDHKIIFIPLFLLILAGAGFYYYKVFWNKTDEKSKKRKKGVISIWQQKVK